jgi:hypothetical protein
VPLSTRVVRRALTSKLGFEEDRDASHPQFLRWHQGQLVAQTHISHGSGGKDVSDKVLGSIARELQVSGPQLRRAIGCSISREEFLALLVDLLAVQSGAPTPRPPPSRAAHRSIVAGFHTEPTQGAHVGWLVVADPFDEDADVRTHLAVLDPTALAELRRILEAPSTYRATLLRGLAARPAAADLDTLIAMAHTDEVVRLRLLRAIRDLSA